MFTQVSLPFPVDAFERNGCADDGRLFACASMLGCLFHVEAVPVVERDGMQSGADAISESRLNALAVEYDAPGFQTVRIGGADYVIFVTPFGR